MNDNELRGERENPQAYTDHGKETPAPLTRQDKLEKIRGIIESNDTAMITTVHEGKLMSRPMKLQEAEYDGTLWFVTKKDTAKYDEIRANPHVNVAFLGKGSVSLSGTAELVEDLALKKRLWNNWLGKFFDLEYDDPQLSLIKVIPESAEYWESVGKVKNVVNIVKAMRGDERAEERLNDSLEFDKGRQ
ncbi:MAG TPA: pyridoxamine 5'-phosphate oxidase family protein [Candidatus Limnocylindria bacterium]|nr:pyridoxamine 5'-phosphate oxidase family protein [Candidatus Limnocylindria bacterium]